MRCWSTSDRAGRRRTPVVSDGMRLAPSEVLASRHRTIHRAIAQQTDRILEVSDGRLVADVPNPAPRGPLTGPAAATIA